MPFPQPLDLEIRPNTSAEDDEHTLRTQRNAMGRSMPSPPQPFMKLYRNLVDSDRADRRGYCREMTEWLTTFLEDPALYGSELCRLQVRHEIRLVKQHTCPAMTGAQFKVFNQAAQMVRTELDPCDSITGQVWASVCRFEIQQYEGRYTNASDAIPREAKQCHRAAQAFDSHPTDQAFWTFRAAYNGERLRQATMQAKPTPRQLGPPLPPPEPTPPTRGEPSRCAQAEEMASYCDQHGQMSNMDVDTMPARAANRSIRCLLPAASEATLHDMAKHLSSEDSVRPAPGQGSWTPRPEQRLFHMDLGTILSWVPEPPVQRFFRVHTAGFTDHNEWAKKTGHPDGGALTGDNDDQIEAWIDSCRRWVGLQHDNLLPSVGQLYEQMVLRAFRSSVAH
jgi:hypothetical protein